MASAAGSSSAGPLLTTNSSLVLLAGLPGDVETENTYREQMQAWLALAQSAGPLRDIYVLCDFKDSLPPPASNQLARMNVLPADRASFLGLRLSLAARGGDTVVVAWGHGGMQRETPVLHVRGPRLTAADFKMLANALGGESRWILFFRGSGSFASALAGERREILSSERDTMFASDPIAMELLLKATKANPTLSFTALGEASGRAVLAWYKERNLARTEEPTFWPGSAPAVLLAEEGSSSTPEAIVNSNSMTVSNKAENTVKSESPGSTNLPAAWPELKRAEPKDYPEADAVVLRRTLSYTLGSSPAVASEQEEFIQILTPEGKQFADFDLAYSPPDEDLSVLDCEVLGPDGKLTRLDPEEVRQGAETAPADYQTAQRKFFSLPGAVPGAVLHLRYRTQWREFPLPHVSLSIPIAAELPLREVSVQVSLPKEAPFHFAFDPGAGLDEPSKSASEPAVRQSSYGTTYVWRFENLAAQPHELLSLPGEPSRLLVSTFPDWADFAQWYGRMSRLADEVTPEISAKAAQLTRGLREDREKIVAIYNYVTRLRYVAVPLGVNSLRPHAAANVLQNQFGDCKDKANLFNALLRASQIPAQLVLVPRFSQAFEAVPGFAFNHAISRVTCGTQTLWVDTTDDVCRFGMLPPGDAGRRVLVVNGESGALDKLPLPEPAHHVLRLRGEVNASGDAGSAPTTLEAEAEGYPDYALREAARAAKENASSLPLLATEFRPANGSFALEKQTASSIAALDQNFTWQAQGTFIALNSEAPGSLFMRAPVWLPKEWDVALHHRSTPLFLNQGYPLRLEEEWAIVLPASARSLALPDPSENRDGPLNWRLEWRQTESHKVSVSFHAELALGEINAVQTSTFQRELRRLMTALASAASYKTNP